MQAPLTLAPTNQTTPPAPTVPVRDLLGMKCNVGELKTYVLIAMIVLLQDTNARGHEYLCWKVTMATIVF